MKLQVSQFLFLTFDLGPKYIHQSQSPERVENVADSVDTFTTAKNTSEKSPTDDESNVIPPSVEECRKTRLTSRKKSQRLFEKSKTTIRKVVHARSHPKIPNASTLSSSSPKLSKLVCRKPLPGIHTYQPLAKKNEQEIIST